MPDYNPAIAAGINSEPVDISKTLGTINQLQIGQAHLGLYNLQALQQQRQYNALQATAAHIRDNPGDSRGALQVYYGAGGDPSGGPSIVNSLATANATSATPGGMLPSEYSQRVGAAKTAAEIPGAVAGSIKAQAGADAEVMKTYGPGVALNPSDDGSWRQLVLAHANAIRGTPNQMNPVEIQAALDVKDPQMRLDGLKRYGFASGVPIEKLTEAFGPGGAAAGDTTMDDYNNRNLTPAQRVGAAPILRPPGQAAAAVESQKESAKYFTDPDKMPKQYAAAQQVKQDMASVMNTVDRLGPAWMGPGAEGKAHFAAAVNTAAASLGIPTVFDEQVAQSQDLGKLARRAGFALASSTFGGSREASQTIQTSINSVVNQGNTVGAAKVIGASIINDAQRKIDRMDYELANKDKMLPIQADREFDKKYPPEMYAKRAIAQSIDPTHLQALREHPEASASFNKAYGNGMAEFVLSNQKFPQ